MTYWNILLTQGGLFLLTHLIFKYIQGKTFSQLSVVQYKILSRRWCILERITDLGVLGLQLGEFLCERAGVTGQARQRVGPHLLPCHPQISQVSLQMRTHALLRIQPAQHSTHSKAFRCACGWMLDRVFLCVFVCMRASVCVCMCVRVRVNLALRSLATSTRLTNCSLVCASAVWASVIWGERGRGTERKSVWKKDFFFEELRSLCFMCSLISSHHYGDRLDDLKSNVIFIWAR